MTKQVQKELSGLKTKAATAQADYDAARTAVDSGETYAKSLERDYREALSSPTDLDRLTDLQARRAAIGTVLSDLQGAMRAAEDVSDNAAEALRHETKLQSALTELSPKAQALIAAYKNDKLPVRVRLATGDALLHNLVERYVDMLRRGDLLRARREIEDVAERVDLSDTTR